MSDAGEPFYSVADLPPPLGIKVRLIWRTAKGVTMPFDGVRWYDKRAKRDRWSTYDFGDLVHLPIPRDAAVGLPWEGWKHLRGHAPLYWAPPHPAHAWRVPLPAPAFLWRDPPPEVRMTYERQEFSAADMAYEMEMTRLGLMPERGETDRPSRVAWQWWRDETKIAWNQTADNLLMKDCEGRLMRAVALSGAGRIGADAGSITSQALAHAIAEAAGYADADASVPFLGAQCDRGDNFLEAMRWFTALGEGNEGWSLRCFSRAQKILVWRSLPMPLSYAEIGELLANPFPQKPGKARKRAAKPITGERVRQIEKEAIEAAWRVGAGLVTTAAEIAVHQLRERNRRAKRTSLETA